MKKLMISLCLSLSCLSLWAQHPALQQKIEQLTAARKADIGVSISVTGGNDKVQINGDKLYPMLSTFKFPIALTVLHQVETGVLTLNQKLFISKEALLDDTWSPFKKEYPEGNIDITLEEALRWVMCYSDNNITDILLRLIGGTAVVQQFIGGNDFIIRNNEADMHTGWDAQFVNKISPGRAVQLLEKFDQGKILDKTHTRWLYKAMLQNKTGLKRLKGKLPPTVPVAHRSGTSFTNEAGMTGAVNSFGIIELPGNKKMIIAIFVHDTYENFDDTEAIIADIAKTAYDFYKQPQAKGH